MSEKRPAVGVGVIVLRGREVLLGKRKGSIGEGTWAAPGGKLDFGESLEACAMREVLEETGLSLSNVRFGTVTNDVLPDDSNHYVTVFMVADAAQGEAQLLEPETCDGWQWFAWNELPSPLFLSWQNLVASSFNPFPEESQNGDLQKLKEMAARAQADLQNAKARLERDREDIGKFAAERFMRNILPTIDNLQRAISHLPTDLAGHEWVKGIVATEQELLRQLEDMGLRKIPALGQIVDPLKHEVLMLDERGGETVTQVFENGYELSGKVLRPAKVKAGPAEVLTSESHLQTKSQVKE